MMTPAGGAERDRRARRLTNDAKSVAGRCLAHVRKFEGSRIGFNVRRTKEKFGHSEKPSTMF